MSTLPSTPPRVMRGASGIASGSQGYVPTPTAGQDAFILRGDGTWAAQPTGTIPSSTGNSGKILTTDGTTPSWSNTPSAITSVVNPRAPAQALAFDGTANSTFGSALPAFGTGDFTVAMRVSTAVSGGIIGGAASAFTLQYNGINLTAGKVDVIDLTAGGATLPTTSSSWVTYRRTGGQGFYGVNGVEASAITDTQDYSVGVSVVGARKPGLTYLTGVIGPAYVFNRALSAAEVLALYQTGAPAAADYNNASNTALSLGNFINSGYETFSGASATGFTAINTTVDGYAYTTSALTLVRGTRYRMSFTCALTSGTLPVAYLGLAGSTVLSAQTRIIAGANVLEFTATASGPANGVFYSFNGESVSYAISAWALTPLGLLCAPDAAQPGRGTDWQDVSGRNADLTLPASGVRWAIPSDSALTGVASITAAAATDLTLAGGTAGTSAVKVSNTTAATNTTSGAFQVAGGMSAQGAGWFGGSVITSTTNTGSAVNTGFSLRNNASASPNNILPSILWDTATLNWQRIDGLRAAGGGFGSTMRFWTMDGSGVEQLRLSLSESGAGELKVFSTTSASSSTVGAFLVGNGTAATNVAIGGGNINAGGTLTVAGISVTGSTTLSGAGAIPITTSLVKFTSTAAANALTLANGVDGQRLTVVHDVKGTLGTGVITPTTKTGFSAVTLTNAGDTVSFVYVTTRGWMVTGSYLATIAP